MKVGVGLIIAVLAVATSPVVVATSGADDSPVVAGPAIGLNCGLELGIASRLCRAAGADLARVEFSISSTPADMQPLVASYASKRIRIQPLAGFHGRIPTMDEARNLRRWALRFGPKGTFWKTHKTARLPFGRIEFGNETSYGWQYGDEPADATYRERARVYALRARDAAISLQGTGVTLLLQADDGGFSSDTWLEEMFEAVPDLGQYAGGWTLHPYGPSGAARIDRLLTALRSRMLPRAPLVFVTEWGLATDDGRALSDNYGYGTNLTYAHAAAVLRAVLDLWRTRYGSALAQVIIFQSSDRMPPGASTDREHYFGVLKADGNAKGAYTAEVRAQLTRAGAARPRAIR